jgi:hypothetical protein
MCVYFVLFKFIFVFILPLNADLYMLFIMMLFIMFALPLYISIYYLNFFCCPLHKFEFYIMFTILFTSSYILFYFMCVIYFCLFRSSSIIILIILCVYILYCLFFLPLPLNADLFCCYVRFPFVHTYFYPIIFNCILLYFATNNGTCQLLLLIFSNFIFIKFCWGQM